MNSQKMDTQTCRLLLIENKADLDIKDVSIRDVDCLCATRRGFVAVYIEKVRSAECT